MDEELKIQIRAYDEFQAVLGRFSTAMESVERSERTVAASTDALTRAVSAMLEALQRARAPTHQQTEEEKAQAEALRKAREEARKKADELKAKAKAEKEAASAAKEHSDQIDNLVQGLVSLGILATVKRGFDEVVQAGAGLDQQLGVTRGLTGEATDAARDFVMALDVERKGVTELTEGLNELARAGYDFQQSAEGLPEIAEFSKAFFKDVDEASAPVLQILKTFQKDVSDAGEVVDVFTVAANRSALGFDDFQLSLAMSAGVAKLAGQDYRELIATLSVLRDAGLGASDGGTSLKSAWMALLNPTTEATKVMKELGITVYDANGRMKSWADIVANMEQALAPLNEQSRNLALTTMFGSDGVRAMALSMGRGSEYIRALTADLKNSKGATAELAHEMGNTFNGAMQRTQANLERMKVLVFEDLKGAMMGLLEALDMLIVGFNSLSGPARTLVEILIGGVGLVGALAAVVSMTKVVGPALAGLSALFTTTATSATAAGTALAAVGGPVGLAIMAVSALTVGLVALVGAQEKARREAEQQQRTLIDLGTRYEELQRVMDDTSRTEAERTQASEELKRLMQQIGDLMPQLVTKWDNEGRAIELNTEKLEANTRAARENKKAKEESALPDLLSKYGQQSSDYAGLVQAMDAVRSALPGTGSVAAANAPRLDTGAIRGALRELGAATGNDYVTLLANAMGIPNAEQRESAIQSLVSGAVADAERVAALLGRELAITGGQIAQISSQTAGTASDVGAGFRPSGPVGGVGGGGTKTLVTEDAEKSRVAAIREQMDLLRHLVVMDDARVDTAAEQLQWLTRIRDTLGTTRELDEAIYELQKDTAREPLQKQLDMFDRRRQLGEMTAREEQWFYENLIANAEQYGLTVKEISDYQIHAALAKKRADTELNQTMMQAYRDQVQLTDMSTQQQLQSLRTLREVFAEGTRERRQLDIEVHQLEKRLQEELHDGAMANIEFEAIMQRWTNDQKLQALRDYLATAKDLTIEQERDLQKTIAQMEQQSERDQQRTLTDLYRDGLETKRRIAEHNLRAEQADQLKDMQDQIEGTTARYEDLLNPLREQLEILQAQTQELERQNRLLDLQRALQEKDQAIADAKKVRNRVVIEAGGALGFTIRRTYDEAKVAELEKDRAKAAENLADEQARQARDRAQENLQEQIRLLEVERDARLKSLNKQMQDLRTKHQDDLAELNSYWTERLTNQNIQAQLELANWKTHYADVLTATQNWVTDMNKTYADLQRPSWESGKALSERLGGPVPTPATTGATGTAAAPNNGTGGAAPVSVTNYGTNNYYGVDGVVQGMAALAAGFSQNLKK